MRRVARRPHGETVVMLGDDHEHRAAEILHRAHPLIRVQFRRTKNRRLFPARAPFDFIESVHAKVQEERPLRPHPRRLVRTRQHLRRLLCNYVHGGVGDWRGGGNGDGRE